MSAPALIALAPGSHDARASRTVREIAAVTRSLRPDLTVEPALLDHPEPDLHMAVVKVAAKGHREVVVAPLLLCSACDAQVDVHRSVREVAARHPAIAVHTAEVLGPDAALLSVLDERLRAALAVARVRELDALVLTAAGSSDPLASASVARLARLWSAHHRLPTSVAFASAAPPSRGEAVREWRRQGRRAVAVGSLFLAAGTLSDRATELALEAGAVAVSEPLGASVTLGRLLLARYCVAALQLVEIPA